MGDNGVTLAQFWSLYSHLRVVWVTSTDEATVRAVELRPGADALVTQRTSPARGTGAPGNMRSLEVIRSLEVTREASPAIHWVTASPVLTAAVLLTALPISPVWTLLLTLNRENIIRLYT